MHGLQGEAAAVAAAELGELHLPEDISILELAGKGRCAVTFKAVYRGEVVALKIYRPDIVDKYRKKHDLNIAVFEMSRNRKFRKNQELFPYSAKPIMVLGHDGRLSLCFIQEFIEGLPLTQLAEKQRGIPFSVLEAGEIIARAAADDDLQDLDLGYRNVMVRQQSGRWLPVVHDFNHVPGERQGGLSGLFKGRHKDNYQLVKEWAEYSERCSKA